MCWPLSISCWDRGGHVLPFTAHLPALGSAGGGHSCCSQHGHHLQEPQAAGGHLSTRSWGFIRPQRHPAEIALATHTISSCLVWRHGDGGDRSSGGPTPRNQSPPCPCTPTSQHRRPVTPRPKLLSAPSQQQGFCGWSEWPAQPGTQPSMGGGRAGSTGLSEGPPPAGPLRPVPLPRRYTDTASQPGEGTWSPEVRGLSGEDMGTAEALRPGRRSGGETSFRQPPTARGIWGSLRGHHQD